MSHDQCDYDVDVIHMKTVLDLLTVVAGGSRVACIVTVAVKGGPGLGAFSSMFTVVG